MKKIFTIVLFTSFSVIFTECDKQLDLKPLGQLDEFTYYQTEKDFDAASLSPYSTLLNLYFNQDNSGWYSTVLYPDDDVVPGNNGSDNQEDFNWTPSNGNFSFLWNTCYTGIQRANVILDRLPAATGFTDENNKPRFEAEAKFIRAYFHYLLQINFATAPLSDKRIFTIDEARKPNSQPGELWDFIISDLEFAKANLPATWDGENVGRATSGAATAMLGKVYLYRAQWDKNAGLYAKAITELSSLVGKYSLATKYDDNFNLNVENNNESIFEIQFTRGDFNPWLPTDFGAANDENVGAAGSARTVLFRPSCGPNNDCAPGANGGGYGKFHATLPLQNEFEANDPRRIQSIYLNGDPFDGTIFNSLWSVTGSTPSKYINGDALDGFP
ncbi:MAG: RagB/SusD family nutrient uptake outer membrane protein, partial [Chryseolinea sp.]